MARISTSKTTVTVIRGLPGVAFVGRVDEADVDHARRLERIRTAYLADLEDARCSLSIDLAALGFSDADIRRAAADPDTITSCRYHA